MVIGTTKLVEAAEIVPLSMKVIARSRSVDLVNHAPEQSPSGKPAREAKVEIFLNKYTQVTCEGARSAILQVLAA